MFLLIETGGGVNRTTVDGRAVDHGDGDTLEDVLKAAGFTIDNGKIQGNVPAGFLVKTPTGTKYVPINDDGTFQNTDDINIQIPLGTTITSKPALAASKKYLTYTITDLNGITHQVPVEVNDADVKAKWSDIVKAAKDNGITIGNTPSDYNGGWKAEGSSSALAGDTPVDPTKPIKPDFTKDLNYTVGGQDVTVKVKYPETQATWEQIKTAARTAGVTIDGKTWQDQNGENVSDSKKYPAGTTFSERVDPPAGEMKPEGMTQDQANEYDNIETNHARNITMKHLLTEWSCKTGDFYQYLIFYYDESDTSAGFVFYGSFDNSQEPKLTPEEAKAKAKAKAKESQRIGEEAIGRGGSVDDMNYEEDCNTGYASIGDSDGDGDPDALNIYIQGLYDEDIDDFYKPESSKNIEGIFYLSKSGQLIARPATGSGDANDFKIGFKWEDGPADRPLPPQ